jgi:glutamate synthase (NADPH/NADH) small chain
MELLSQQNRRVAGEEIPASGAITATGKRVVILGGGDTGSDCLGTSHRQGAAVVYQFELLPKPPDQRSQGTPWQLWPMMLRTSTSHEEGGIRKSAHARRCLAPAIVPPRSTSACAARRERPVELPFLSRGVPPEGPPVTCSI